MAFPTRKKKLTSTRLIRQRIRRDIVREQRRETLVIPHAVIKRVVCEYLRSIRPDFSMSSDGHLLLQAAAEEHTTEVFTESMRLLHYENRLTMYKDDMSFAQGRWLKRTRVGADDAEQHDCIE